MIVACVYDQLAKTVVDYTALTLLSPGGGAERHPLRVFLIAHKRMLRSLRNFLTFPKYQK